MTLSLSLSDDVRLFGFVRITTGDAMSKRAKFTLITWIGENVSGLQRAKISTDKTLVKDIVQVRDSVLTHTHMIPSQISNINVLLKYSTLNGT